MTAAERLAVAAVLAVAAWIAWPAALGMVRATDDLGALHAPLHAFVESCARAGDSPAWFPDGFSGYDLHGEGQAGLHHPAHRLLLRALPWPAAQGVELALPPLLAFAGFLLLLRRHVSPEAAAAGALTGGLSAFLTLHFVHPPLAQVAAHAPWLLWASEEALAGDRPRGRLVLGLATASQGLLGSPQAWWITLVAEAVWVTAVVLERRSTLGVAGLLVAQALGAAVAATQLVPTWEALALSRRAAADPRFPYEFSLDPANLLQLVGPYVFENRTFDSYTAEGGAYPGAAASIAWAWVVARRRSLGAARRLVGAAAALTVLGLALALGEHAPVYRLHVALPVAGSFRCPSRFVFLVHLGAALAVAAAVDGTRAASRAVLAAPLIAALAAGAAFACRAADNAVGAQVSRSDLALLAGPALVGVAAWLFARGRTRALVLFIALDLGAYGLSFVERVPPVAPDAIGGVPRAVALAPGRAYVDAKTLAPTLAGVRLASGFSGGLEPGKRLDLSDPAHLRVAWVRWLGLADGTWTALDPMPRAWVVGEALASRDPSRELGRVDLARVAIVDAPLAVPRGGGPARVTRERPGRIDVQASARGLLVLSESWHPGWRARHLIRGEVPLVRVNGDFMGAVLDEPGEVAFTFEPRSHRVGWWVTVAAVVIGALAAAADRRRTS